MATETVETYDGQGNLVGTRQVTVPQEAANRAQIVSRGEQALTVNAVYLSLGSPTAAQTAAQVKNLTRECNAIFRLLLGLVQDISDT